jgi:hypothetical protein
MPEPDTGPADSFTLGAAQVQPVYHDREATLEIACH